MQWGGRPEPRLFLSKVSVKVNIYSTIIRRKWFLYKRYACIQSTGGFRPSSRNRSKFSVNFFLYIFYLIRGCQVLWWVCLSVSDCLSAGISPPHARSLPILCLCRGSVLLRYVDDRPHRLSAGNCKMKKTGVHSAGEVCNQRLPCFLVVEDSHSNVLDHLLNVLT